LGHIDVLKSAPVARLRDLIELGKPRLSMLVLFTAATGVAAAPSVASPWRAAVFVAATACLVVSANTLNCWIEREIDARMRRTRERPLPTGRLEPRVALASGSFLAVLSLTTLALVSNPLTTILGATALISYAAVYTPLKRVTPWSVIVGAIPGALPPLMGWTAATGEFGLGGWYLFGVLFFWQLPHFIAISVYLREDFMRGGLRVMSVVFSPLTVRRFIFAFTVLLVAWSLLPQILGLAGTLYTVAAAILGTIFLVYAAAGLRRDAGVAQARKVFLWSLLYLPFLIVAYLLA
jgi:protoheme IX farnesyltransferase